MKNKGITLIALVVTIIILLILAGVTIGVATNGTGLFEKAKLATEQYNNAVDKENIELAKAANQIDEVVFTSRAPVTRSILYDTVIQTTSSSTNLIDLNDSVKNYDYIIINVAWRYGHSSGDQNRQYYLDTSLIELRDDTTKYNDYVFIYGYNNKDDSISLCFLKQNKLNIQINAVTSPYTVALTKVIGIKF